FLGGEPERSLLFVLSGRNESGSSASNGFIAYNAITVRRRIGCCSGSAVMMVCDEFLMCSFFVKGEFSCGLTLVIDG
ncbi:MAG: hypothetical protein KGM99_19210, partial [Burkholderiales bacterium]|nr:hypothetical protein [Burkholderiales bacterium]